MAELERSELVPWRTVSYVMCILLLILQQVGMMHYMYQCQSWCIYLAILDAICLCDWVFYTVPKLVGIKGANCWIIYSRIMTIKMLVVYYIVFPVIITKDGLIMRSACGASTELILLLLLTPTLYALMSFRAGAHLYGGFNCISSERLMHTDQIIHVVFDLLDVMNVCHIFITLPTKSHQRNYILNAFCGVVIGTVIFLHAYSFPRMSETSRLKQNGSFKVDSRQGVSDIYYCRKYSAIVGIFFVDVPFGILRITAWLLFAQHAIYGPFLLKNIFFIMLQASRIRHCSIGIRTMNYSKALNDSHEMDIQHVPAAEPISEDDHHPLVNDDVIDTEIRNSRFDAKKHYVRFSTPTRVINSDNEYNILHSATIRSKRTIRLSAKDLRAKLATSITIPEGFCMTAVNFKRLLQKILLVISVGSKSEISHLLDYKLRLSLWHNALLAIPHITLWIAEVTIVIMLYRLDEKEIPQYRGLFDFIGLSEISYRSLPICLQVTPFLIMAAGLINLICWAAISSFLGAILVCFQVIVTLVSFSYVLLSLSEFIPALHILGFISQHIMGTPRDYLFFLFGVKPFLNLLSGLYPFLCLTLGKHYIFYINPSILSMKNTDIIRDSVKLINSTFSVNIEGIGHDESCAISLASLLVLTNAKIMCAPPSGHSLLIGNNLIKATRLDKALINCHKSSFVRTLLIRMYCILMVVGKNDHAYSCAIMVYIVHMLLILSYCFFSMSVRRMHIDAVSTQAICADILRETRTQRARYNKMLPYERDHVNTTPLTSSHWIFKKHERNKQFF